MKRQQPQQQPQPQKKVPKKAAATAKNTRGRKAQQAAKNVPESASTSAPELAPEPAPESAIAPAPNHASEPTHEQAPELVYEQEPESARELEQEPELEYAIATIEQPVVPAAPRTVSRTMAQGPSKAIPFKPTAEKRPRGRPPKSKSSTNDEGEPMPHEHIDTALAASQPNLPTTVNPALLSNHSPIVSTAPTTRKATRSRGLDHNVDVRQDPEEPLREQRRRERSRSQSYDNAPLPPLPPMNMHVDNDNNIVLESMMSFQEIDSGEINSDVRQDLLSQFTNHNRNHRWRPNNGPIREENTDTTRPFKEQFVGFVEGTSSSSSPDPIEKW